MSNEVSEEDVMEVIAFLEERHGTLTPEELRSIAINSYGNNNSTPQELAPRIQEDSLINHPISTPQTSLVLDMNHYKQFNKVKRI